jgi:hypothetical protein
MSNRMISAARTAPKAPRVTTWQAARMLATLILLRTLRSKRAAPRHDEPGQHDQAGHGPAPFVDTDWAWKELAPPG